MGDASFTDGTGRSAGGAGIVYKAGTRSGIGVGLLYIYMYSVYIATLLVYIACIYTHAIYTSIYSMYIYTCYIYT